MRHERVEPVRHERVEPVRHERVELEPLAIMMMVAAAIFPFYWFKRKGWL